MVRTKQGGSVLTFIMGGVLLTVFLIGGIYWISQQNKSNNTPLPTPPAPQAPIESAPQPSKEPANPDRPRQQQNETESAPPQLPSNGEPTANELPATGPREVVTSSLVFALLCGVAISYLRSRRETASL